MNVVIRTVQEKGHSVETLLLIGSGPETSFAIEYARKLGVKTILTDYLSAAQNPDKALADEHWEINIKDIDRLEEQAHKSHVTAIFAGSNEMCLDTVRTLCKRMSLPFYASDEAYQALRDKQYFKKIAQECGIPVPKSYAVTPEMIESGTGDFEFPVIIKPVDSSASRGITVCFEADELPKAYAKALAESPTKTILVEEYVQASLSGKDTSVAASNVNIFFIVWRHGVPSVRYVVTNVMHFVNFKCAERGMQLSVVGYLDMNVERFGLDMGAVKRFGERLHISDGVATLQGIYNGEKAVFFEFGYRLDGTGVWKAAEEAGDINQLELMVDLALGRAPDEGNLDKRPLAGTAACVKVEMFGRAGTVDGVEGVDKVARMPGSTILLNRCYKGHEITMDGSSRGKALSVAMAAPSLEELVDKIQYVIDTVHVCDADGNSLLMS